MSSSTAVATAENGNPIIVDELVDDGVYGKYALARIRKSPDNRKRFNEQALQELAASIKEVGVAQPILIRPVTPTAEAPEDFEIVAGERRYRASIIAGMTEIPAMARTMTDLVAAKIRILENLQREDPHPMEEAEGYQLLMLKHGFTAAQLVDEVKKSKAYIYARLKLCDLTTEVREGFLDGKIEASTALLIARIPAPKLQVQALEEILNPPAWKSNGPLSYRQAAEHVQSRFMLSLSTAIFAQADSKLLASAGACTKCPKRAGNQPEVFEGVAADVCTDPDCFAEKRAAHHAVTLVHANKKGIPVFEGDEGRDKLPRNWENDSEFVTDEAMLWSFSRNAPHTKNQGRAKAFLKTDAMPPVAAYIKADDGTVTAIYRRVAMQAALEGAGACETVETHAERMSQVVAGPGEVTPAKAQEEAREKAAKALDEKAAETTAFRVELYTRLRKQAAANGFCLQSLREFTKVAMNEFSLPEELASIYPFDRHDEEAIAAHIDQAGLPEVQLLLVDALLGSALHVSAWDLKNGNADEDDFSTIIDIANFEGINANQVREEMFPTPIDVTSMQYANLVEFIKAHPARINELKEKIIHERPDLLTALDQAALPRFMHDVGGFRPMQPDDILGFLQGAPDRVNELAKAVISSGTVEQADAFCEAATQLGYSLSEGLWMPPSLRVSEKPAQKAVPEQSIDNATSPEVSTDDDAEQLAEQLASVEAAKPAVAKHAKAKVLKAKPASLAFPKHAKEPAGKPATAQAMKPAEAAKAAPAPRTLEAAAEWPFPKSSMGKREAAPAPVAAEQPAKAEVAA